MKKSTIALKKALQQLPQMDLSEEATEEPQGPTQVSILKHIQELQREISETKRNLERKTRELSNIQNLSCVICGAGIYWLGRGRHARFCERCKRTRRGAYHLTWSQKNRERLRAYKKRWREKRRKLAIPMEIEPPKELPPWIKDAEE